MSLVESIAATFLPYWPPEHAPLKERAQGLREFSALLRQHSETVAEAQRRAAAGNARPAMFAADEVAMGPGGHADSLADSAASLSEIADHTESYAHFCQAMRILIIGAVVAVAFLCVVNPAAASLRLAAAHAQIQGLRETFLRRFAEAFVKPEGRQAVKMNQKWFGKASDSEKGAADKLAYNTRHMQEDVAGELNTKGKDAQNKGDFDEAAKQYHSRDWTLGNEN